jgi:predicted hotdog family 3-hydroxylacyl-ACP dehydratase
MITDYNIEQVLPHAHPMILLSQFIEAGAEHAVCTVDIDRNSPFYDDTQQAVPAYVGVEYMAQTIAAYAGAHALATGGTVKIGFLLGCRKYQPATPGFQAGQTLHIQVRKLVMEDSGLSVFECQILHQQQLLVAANLNVFQPDDHKVWLTE